MAVQNTNERLLELNVRIAELELQIAKSQSKGMIATLNFYLDGFKKEKELIYKKELESDIQELVEQSDTFDNAVIATFTEQGNCHVYAVTEDHKIAEMKHTAKGKVCEVCGRYLYFNPVENVNYCTDCDSKIIYWYD